MNAIASVALGNVFTVGLNRRCASECFIPQNPQLKYYSFYYFSPLPIPYSDIPIVNKSDPHALEVLMTVGLDWPAFSRNEIFDSHESRPPHMAIQNWAIISKLDYLTAGWKFNTCFNPF